MTSLKNRLLQVPFVFGVTLALCVLVSLPVEAKNFRARKATDSAQKVDQLILADLSESEAEIAGKVSDEDFLRRVTFDLTGTLPTPDDITLFGLDPDPQKRERVIDQLLQSPAFAENWARYWRDVIFSRATDPRARRMIGAFDKWMTEQIDSGTSWDQITTEILTATGSVLEEGDTALMYAHNGSAEEIAAETSRIFLGIQIQCANCHDHPTDEWRREQFHQLAAFFPRVRVRRVKDSMPRVFEVVSFNNAARANANGQLGQFRQNPEKLFRLLDQDRDGVLTQQEVKKRKGLNRAFKQLLKVGDKNNDNGLSIEEFKKLPPPNIRRQATAEYYMPNLDDPTSKGTRIDPTFFVAGQTPDKGLDDIDRRSLLARYITTRDNPWFARAFVNRIWAELIGEGFTMPVDDMGPEREIAHPEVLEELSDGFVASGYDMRWLMRAICNSDAYQRQIRSVDPAAMPGQFAAAMPMRLRADQLYNALTRALGFDGLAQEGSARRRKAAQYRPVGPRAAFEDLFGYDPSTPQVDLTGTVPQALFLMNSTLINNRVSATGYTPLAKLLKTYEDDADVMSELYLLVLAREPSERERTVCRDYIAEVGDRNEAFEDIMWSLINSTEFRTKR